VIYVTKGNHALWVFVGRKRRIKRFIGSFSRKGLIPISLESEIPIHESSFGAGGVEEGGGMRGEKVQKGRCREWGDGVWSGKGIGQD